MDQMIMQSVAVVEAILFMYGKDVTYARIAELMEIDEEQVEEYVLLLQRSYEERRAGLRILIVDRSVQMVTHPDVAHVIDHMTKKELEGPLTPVAMEVLSIIAYRGPISKVDIEAIRGVNCSFTIRNLVRRGLIERVQDENTGKRSHLYFVTIDLLRLLGVESVEELPEFGELSADKRIDAILIRENMSGESIMQ